MLDITRLISRAGRVATGIDRVELAYLQRLLIETGAISADMINNRLSNPEIPEDERQMLEDSL